VLYVAAGPGTALQKGQVGSKYQSCRQGTIQWSGLAFILRDTLAILPWTHPCYSPLGPHYPAGYSTAPRQPRRYPVQPTAHSTILLPTDERATVHGARKSHNMLPCMTVAQGSHDTALNGQSRQGTSSRGGGGRLRQGNGLAIWRCLTYPA